MLKTHPIKRSHAISEVAFVAQFAGDLETVFPKLMQLEEKLRSELPKMEKATALGIQIKDNRLSASLGEKIAGVTFRHYSADGKMTWALRAENNFITVNCTDYSRWKSVWPRAKKYLGYALEVVVGPEHPIDAIGLKYVDKFVYSGLSEEYSYEDVFRKDTIYLMEKCRTVGAFWHVHQGWFDKPGQDSKCLNVLNINTAQAGGEHQTVIDHSAIMQFFELQTSYNALFTTTDTTESKIDKMFGELHDKNKDVLKGLLNDSMLKSINMS